MEYKAEDGYVIISEKNKSVTYSCRSNFTDGIYTSYETTADNTVIGIKQIKIVRNISNGICNYLITESSNEELQNYLNELIQNNI